MRPSNPEQFHKILERICILLEQELGGDARSWLATCLVLLQTIADAAEIDINDVAAMLIKCHRPPDDIPPIH